MQEDTKISDLTVAELRQLMAQCFKAQKDKEYQEIWGPAIQAQNAASGVISEANGLAWAQARTNQFRKSQP